MDILPQLLVNALIAGSLYALTTSGLSLVFGLLRILNFAHGHLMMMGAYLFYLANVELGWNLPLSVLFTIVSVIALSLISLNVFVKPFLSYSTLMPLVSTLALASILEAVVSIAFGVNVKSFSLSMSNESYQIGSIYITPVQIIIIASAFVSMLILAFVVHNTSFGRRLRALSENRYWAEGVGIDFKSTYAVVFTAGTLLAAYSGVMVGLETNLQPTMGNNYTIKAFAAMILGGLGNIWGSIAGSFILALVENLSIGLDFGSYSLPAGYKDAFAFAIILVVLMVRPQGLFGKRLRQA